MSSAASPEQSLLRGAAVLGAPKATPNLGRYSIEIVPNRDRGYDALIYYTFPRSKEMEFVNCINGVNEEQARGKAETYIEQRREQEKEERRQRKPRAGRALSEGELESREAARIERDYV